MTHATWPYRATTCQERELTLDIIHTFLTTRVHGGPPWMRDQLNTMATVPLRQHKHERRYTTSMHSFILTRRIQKDDNGGQMIFGDLGGLKLPEICLKGEGKPRNKPHPGNCDRGSNPGPLRDRCYRLLHSGGPTAYI